jgi:hypothetical protein
LAGTGFGAGASVAAKSGLARMMREK